MICMFELLIVMLALVVFNFGLFFIFGLIEGKKILPKGEIATLSFYYSMMTSGAFTAVVALFGINVYTVIAILLINVLFFNLFNKSVEIHRDAEKFMQTARQMNRFLNGNLK